MRNRIGMGVSVIGGLLILAGLIGLLTQSDDGSATTSSTADAAPVGPATASTTTAVRQSTSAVATTGEATTTAPTTAAPTTVTSTPAQTVDEFFIDYVTAIEARNVDFLYDRLHPVVLEQPTADLCRAFIEREILALGDYRATGTVTGPLEHEVAGTLVTDFHSLPVAFEFQGQTFDGTATFAPVDGQMHWFTECR